MDHQTIIYAAGGLLWRTVDDRRLLAVVHRPRYDDWSLPKGKLNTGEDFEAAALREVQEETGCRAGLDRPAGKLHYQVEGRRKEVRFWHMRLEQEGPFQPSAEIDRLEWLTIDAAQARLSYADERALVRAASLSASFFDRYKLLILLFLADIVFILLHLVYVYTPYLPSVNFSLTFAGGYAEFFQYTKEFWIAALFLALAIQHRKIIYGALSLLFFYLLFDDSFEFHENFGATVAEFFNFQPAFGLRAVDFGEIGVSVIFGGLLFAALLAAYWLSDPVARRVALYTTAMIIVLVFFGVFLDMFDVLIQDEGVAIIFRTVEEGGELMVMSVITWFAFNLDHYIRSSFSNRYPP
ncbi:MAG TPA: NUDIX hydrolase [Levilinea sp.]|nr:NUDIX hydrolase [Levilinea sp.]